MTWFVYTVKCGNVGLSMKRVIHSVLYLWTLYILYSFVFVIDMFRSLESLVRKCIVVVLWTADFSCPWFNISITGEGDWFWNESRATRAKKSGHLAFEAYKNHRSAAVRGRSSGAPPWSASAFKKVTRSSILNHILLNFNLYSLAYGRGPMIFMLQR